MAVTATALIPKSVQAMIGQSDLPNNTKTEHTDKPPNDSESGGILTPDTSYNEDAYPKEYWGTQGFALQGTDIEEGGKTWGADCGKPLLHEDMIFNPPGKRSTRNWREIITHFNLDNPNNARYVPRDGKTFCNIALSDLTRAFGIWIPHWYKDNDGNLQPTYANKIYDQLQTGFDFSRNKSWIPISEEQAIKLANRGIPVVMAIRNNTGHSGHVGLIAPDSSHEQLKIAQAGRVNGIVSFNRSTYNEENGYTQPLFAINQSDYSNT